MSWFGKREKRALKHAAVAVVVLLGAVLVKVAQETIKELEEIDGAGTDAVPEREAE